LKKKSGRYPKYENLLAYNAIIVDEQVERIVIAYDDNLELEAYPVIDWIKGGEESEVDDLITDSLRLLQDLKDSIPLLVEGEMLAKKISIKKDFPVNSGLIHEYLSYDPDKPIFFKMMNYNDTNRFEVKIEYFDADHFKLTRTIISEDPKANINTSEYVIDKSGRINRVEHSGDNAGYTYEYTYGDDGALKESKRNFYHTKTDGEDSGFSQNSRISNIQFSDMGESGTEVVYSEDTVYSDNRSIQSAKETRFIITDDQDVYLVVDNNKRVLLKDTETDDEARSYYHKIKQSMNNSHPDPDLMLNTQKAALDIKINRQID
jgi:hypothetical protein